MSAQFEDGKDEGALRTIGEVAKALDIKTHVLRYWEQQFPMLQPLKRSGGRRYYRADDIVIIETINRLVNDEGYTIKGARKALSDGKSASAKSDPVDDADKTGADDEMDDEDKNPDVTDEPITDTPAHDGEMDEMAAGTASQPVDESAMPVAEDGGVDAFFGRGTAPDQEPPPPDMIGEPEWDMAEEQAPAADDRMPRAEILARLKELRSELAEALAA